MPTGAPLPVREYRSAEENRRHAAEVHARIWGAVPPKRPEPRVEVQPAAVAAELSSRELVEPGHAKPADPFVERTLAEFGRIEISSVQQREGRAEISGGVVLRLVSMITGITQRDIAGERRTFILVKARQIAMWLLVRRAKKSLPEAGMLLGGRDHTTVRHGVNRVDATLTTLCLDPEVSAADLAEQMWAAKWPREKTLPNSKLRGGPCA